MNKLILIIFLTIATLGLNGQTVANFAFDTDSDPDKLNVVMKLSFDVPGQLGSSNIRFSFDDAVLANPVMTDVLIDDNGETYFNISMTETNADGTPLVSFNSTFFGGTGFAVPAGVGNEVPIAVIQFDIIDAGANTTDLLWRSTSEASGPTLIRTTTNTILGDGSLTDSPNAPLPVELKSFDVKPFGKNSSKLTWKAETEINFSHYEIERSFDGRSWENLANEAGKAFNGLSATYDYLDEDILLPRTNNPVVYYRLKMVDNNGEYEYSEIKSLSFNRDVQVEVYPNPTTKFVTIQSTDEIVQIRLFDADGKLVIDQNYLDARLDLDNLNSGMYRLLISTTNGDYEKSIIKID